MIFRVHLCGFGRPHLHTFMSTHAPISAVTSHYSLLSRSQPNSEIAQPLKMQISNSVMFSCSHRLIPGHLGVQRDKICAKIWSLLVILAWLFYTVLSIWNVCFHLVCLLSFYSSFKTSSDGTLLLRTPQIFFPLVILLMVDSHVVSWLLIFL